MSGKKWRRLSKTIGNVFVDLGKLAFGSLMLGSILKGGMSLPAASGGVSLVERRGGSFCKEIYHMGGLLPIFVSATDSNRRKRRGIKPQVRINPFQTFVFGAGLTMIAFAAGIWLISISEE